MELFTSEDLPNETVTISAKELKTKRTSKITTTNEAIYNHEFSQILHQEEEVHESIIATETSLQHFTMESNIDNTAELLPSGGIHSHHHGIKTAVSETSPPQLTSTIVNSKVNVKNPPSLSPIYCQGKALRTESRKKVAQPGLDLPEGVLDMGRTEPQDNDTFDLYSDGIYGTHLKTPYYSEDIEQCVTLKRQSDDHDNEDLYTDSNLYEGKHSSFGLDFRRKIRLKMEMTDGILLNNKVWNVPNPTEEHRKLSGMKLEPGSSKQIGSTEEGDHEENVEESWTLKNTEHGDQITGPHCQDGVTSQTFIDVPTEHENNLTDDIELNILQDNKTNDDHITVKHDTDKKQKKSNHGSEEENQCEDEAANDKILKDEVYFETINDKNDQKLDVENNTSKIFYETASSKETHDSISGILGMCPLGINSGQVTFLSLEGGNLENADNPTQGYSKTLSSDGDSLSLESRSSDIVDKPLQGYFKTLSSDGESQPSTQQIIPTGASQEEKPLPFKNTANQAQICSNNVVIGNIENHGSNIRGINILRNNEIDQPELQKNRDLLIICPERDNSGKATTPILISKNKLCEINCVSSESDLMSTGFANDGITRESSSKDVTKDFNDTGQQALLDVHHAKHETSDEHQLAYAKVIVQEDQVSSNTVSVNKDCRRDDNHIIEITKKQFHSHDKDYGTANQKESPKKEDTSESELQAMSNKNYNDSVTSSKLKSNESLQINNSPISNRSPDPSINSSELASKTTCALTEPCFASPSYSMKKISEGESNEYSTTISNPSNQSLKNFPAISHQCRPISVHSVDFHNATSLDQHNKCQSTFPHVTYQPKSNSFNLSKITLNDLPDQYKATVSDSNHFSVSPLDPSSQFTTIVPESPFDSRITCLEPSDQITTIFPNSTDKETKNSSDSSVLRTKIPSDLSDHRNNSSDSSNQGKLRCLQTSDQCSTINPDSAFNCSLNQYDLTSQHENNSHDLPDIFRSISSDLFNNCNNTTPDPINQCTPSNPNSTDQRKNYLSHQPYSSDSLNLCTMISSDPSNQCKTIIIQSLDQVKIKSLNTIDHCAIMIPDSELQHTGNSVNPFDQPTNHSKNNSSAMSHQLTITSSDISNHWPTIVPEDSSHHCGFTSEEPSDKNTTTSSQLTCEQTNHGSSLSNQSVINYSILSKIISQDAPGECTTTYHSTYEYNFSPLDQSDQYTTAALNSSDECRTISLSSSNHIPSLLDSYQNTSSPTPSIPFITNSLEPSDLHTNASDPSCQAPLPDLSKQCVINNENRPLLCNIHSDQSLNVSVSDIADSCTKGPIYEFINTSSKDEEIAASRGSSFQCTYDFPNGINQLTKITPNQCDKCMDNTDDLGNSSSTCTTSPSHQCIFPSETSRHSITILDCSSDNPCTTSLPNSSRQSTTSPPDPHTSNNPDLPGRSTAFFSDPDLPCTTNYPVPTFRDTINLEESSNQYTNIFVDSQLSQYNIDGGSFKEPIQDEHGRVIKQHESSFLGEVRRIYLDNQGKGFSLLDSGIILRKRVHRWKNIALMILRNGKELGTVIRSSQLFLYYQLGKHFCVTHQLNEDWYHTQDRITKETMLMKKVTGENATRSRAPYRC